jgi:hypothetical protein
VTLSPGLFVNSCFLGAPSVADDIAQVVKTADEGADVVFGEPAAGLVADLAGVRARAGARSALTCRVHSAMVGGSTPVSRAAWSAQPTEKFLASEVEQQRCSGIDGLDHGPEGLESGD